MSRRRSLRRVSTEPRARIGDVPTKPPDRKALQLAHQVREALSWALGSTPVDDRLAACRIETVEPLSGGNRLLVKVGVPPDLSAADVAERLETAAPILRGEVAQAITRRKVPELVYLPVPVS